MGATKEGWIKRKLNGNGVSWNKGMKFPYKPRPKMKGRPTWNAGITGEKSHMFGKKHMLGKKASDETKKKMSESAKRNGNKPPSWKGKHHSPETIQKMIKSQLENQKINPNPKGEKSPHWKGGITSINHKIRTSPEYADWRLKVFERDNYTCVECGSRGVTLHADHIKPFAYYPELRLVIENGRTLCVPCHKKTDTYSGKGRKLSGILTNA